MSEYTKESLIIYLLSCIIYFFILWKLQAIKVALTFIAITIGRFVWFDSTGDKIFEDFINLFQTLKAMPFGTITLVMCIIVAVLIENEIFIGIVFCGTTIALITFMLYVRNTLKIVSTDTN